MTRRKSCQRNAISKLESSKPAVQTHNKDSEHPSHNTVPSIDILREDMCQATWRGVQYIFEAVDGMLELE